MFRTLLVTATMLFAMVLSGAYSTPQSFASTCEPIWQMAGNVERRGCCSHHNGVCGCNSLTGMQRCCDGTDSPSCKCGE